MSVLWRSSFSFFVRGRGDLGECSVCLQEGSITLLSSIKMIQLSAKRQSRALLPLTEACCSGPVLYRAWNSSSIWAMCLGKQWVSGREMRHCCQLPNSPSHGPCSPGSSVSPLDTSMWLLLLCALTAAP